MLNYLFVVGPAQKGLILSMYEALSSGNDPQFLSVITATITERPYCCLSPADPDYKLLADEALQRY